MRIPVINTGMTIVNDISKKILTDDKIASAVEYIFSKAIAEGLSSTVKFIYKNHKIIKNQRKLYSIYRLTDGKKLYGGLKYQDMAKYIIDNLNNQNKIDDIINKEWEVSRFRDKIEFLKAQYRKTQKEVLLAKIDQAIIGYHLAKSEFLATLGKHNIC